MGSILAIAAILFQQFKLAIGKAIQLSGGRSVWIRESIGKNNITVVNTSVKEVFANAAKLKEK